MYLAVVILTMVVLPVASIVAELLQTGGDLLSLIGKWFVFWAAGVRLFSAGINQALRPSFTSTHIFRIADPGAAKLVQEIGFGNIGIGAIAILSLFIPVWRLPAAIASALFLGLAGIKHVMNRGKSVNEALALGSDLAVALILAMWIVATIFSIGV